MATVNESANGGKCMFEQFEQLCGGSNDITIVYFEVIILREGRI